MLSKMSAILARHAASVAGGLLGLVGFVLGLLGLPNLDQLKELLARIQEMLTLGGMALATGVSLVFILIWVLTWLRRPSNKSRPVLPWLALFTAYVPVGLTLVAAIGRFMPVLAPYVLKAFALAVLVAAFASSFAVIGVLRGGKKEDLNRARKAILLSGTPWYCLAVWLGTLL